MAQYPVGLVVSGEASGIDRYSQELAKRLCVQPIPTSRYKSVLEYVRLAKRLLGLNYPIHLPNQHLGRWVSILRQPSIVTVHDLVRLCFPFAGEGWLSAPGLLLDKKGIEKATHVICVSQATKRDLIQHLDIPEKRITVVYNGVDHDVFKPQVGKQVLGIDLPYLLYVGSERPRKNLKALVDAFALVKRLGRSFESLKLLKVGSAGRSLSFRITTLEAARRLGVADELLFVEDVSDDQLAVLYSNATALVFPSLYEGFGLPVLEAMDCGCPVMQVKMKTFQEKKFLQ